MLDSNLEPANLVLGEFARQQVQIADQDDLDAEVARRRHRAFDGRLGSEVAPHRVKRDSHAPLRTAYSAVSASCRPR